MAHRVLCRTLENNQIQVVARHHSWVADEPPDVQGDDLGPTPFELLLSAIGSCTVLEVRTLAASAGVPVEKVSAEVSGEWRGQNREKHYRIVCTVTVRGELSEKDLERVRRWAGRCPVGRIVGEGADLEIEVQRV